MAVGGVVQVNVSLLARVGLEHHTPPAAHASALALSAQEMSMSWALVSVMTPLTVMVWLLPDHPEAERVWVRRVGLLTLPDPSMVYVLPLWLPVIPPVAFSVNVFTPLMVAAAPAGP